MVYKQILVPDKKNHTVELPEKFYGKKIEMIIVELEDSARNMHPVPPFGKKVNLNDLFKDFGAAPGFPSIDEIRDKAWQ